MLTGILFGWGMGRYYGHKIRKGEQKVEAKVIEDELLEFDHMPNRAGSESL